MGIYLRTLCLGYPDIYILGVYRLIEAMAELGGGGLECNDPGTCLRFFVTSWVQPSFRSPVCILVEFCVSRQSALHGGIMSQEKLHRLRGYLKTPEGAGCTVHQNTVRSSFGVRRNKLWAPVRARG